MPVIMPAPSLVLEVSLWSSAVTLKTLNIWHRLCYYLHSSIHQPTQSLSATQGTPSIICKYRGVVVERARIQKGGF